MDAFSFLSVLLSIILGLAITQILQGLGRLMTARARVTFYWPPMVIGVTLLVSFVQSWWGMFGLRTHADWTFLGFFIVILQTVFSYLQAATILPEFAIESTVDMRANYFGHDSMSPSIFFGWCWPASPPSSGAIGCTSCSPSSSR